MTKLKEKYILKPPRLSKDTNVRKWQEENAKYWCPEHQTYCCTGHNVKFAGIGSGDDDDRKRKRRSSLTNLLVGGVVLVVAACAIAAVSTLSKMANEMGGWQALQEKASTEEGRNEILEQGKAEAKKETESQLKRAGERKALDGFKGGNKIDKPDIYKEESAVVKAIGDEVKRKAESRLVAVETELKESRTELAELKAENEKLIESDKTTDERLKQYAEREEKIQEKVTKFEEMRATVKAELDMLTRSQLTSTAQKPEQLFRTLPEGAGYQSGSDFATRGPQIPPNDLQNFTNQNRISDLELDVGQIMDAISPPPVSPVSNR